MKRSIKGFALVLSTLAIFGCSPLDESQTKQPQSLKSDETTVLVVNADIVTMNPNNPSADAMAFQGDRIIAVGSESEVRGQVSEYDKFYNLEGRTVVPGFFESHDHLYMASMTNIIPDVSPYSTPSLAGALEKLAHSQPDKDGWVVAFGADQELYEEKRGPTRDLLDKIFPKTPVLIIHLSGHGGFVNSKALQIAGINENTPNPTGGFYEKDENGKLTGYLAGQPALFSVKPYPNPTPESARLAAEERARKGVTTASEFGIMNVMVLEGLQEATSSPTFPVRVVGGLFSTIPDFEEVAPRLKSYETDLLKIPFIKTWTDGSIQGGTAVLSDGYHEPEMSEGGAQGTQEFFNKQILRMYELGLWPAVHANGDGAVDTALNAIEYAQKKLGNKASPSIRPQLIHVNYSRPEQMKRMAQLGVMPTLFPTHVYYFGDLHYEKTLGPERAQRLSAIKDAFEAGIKPSMHNDAPVTPVNPLLNMWIAVKRTTQSGRVLGSEQAITPHQALEAYTINAAYQFGMEKDAGSLESGKYADFVVLDKNPLKVDVDDIRHIQVLTTVLGGKVTYSDVPEYDRTEPPRGDL